MRKPTLRAKLMRSSRKAAGFAALGIGIPLLVLPGPGTPFIIAGLALLEPEYHWAGRARTRYLHALNAFKTAGQRALRRRR
jgi:hypothetical protein